MLRPIIIFIVSLLVVLINIEAKPQYDQVQPISTTTEEPTTWNKIKKGVEQGWKVVYDESHCAFHKVKELVNPHDHPEGTDPCENKPYKQNTTEKAIVAEDIYSAPTTQKPR